jgi:thiol-disulfide isomerase/thioredoxin
LVKHYNATRFPGNEDSPLWRQELRSLAESRNPHVADAARSQLQFLDLARAPIEIAFTAADGREVDLRQLRGKVVLVDFWATWCAPCIAELPTVKKVYSAYRDKGFEIVGISLENPGIRPNDSAEQRKAKLEKARMALLEFAQRENLPWPQYFDGKWWKNEIAQRYAVQSIPAMFLLDKNGMLVTTDARGPRLEAEVKRLLAE